MATDNGPVLHTAAHPLHHLTPLDRARLAHGEANQALVRLRASIAYLLVLGTIALLGHGSVIDAAWGPALAYSGFAAIWIVLVKANVIARPIRMRLSLLLDHLIFAYGFYAGEAGFALVFWAPIFSTIGNGLRFGADFARASMVVGGLLMSIAVVISPYWQAQPFLAAGIVIGAIALPFYALYLSRKIETGRQHAESKALQFERAAGTDPLTGLYNRRGFSELLDHHLNDPGTSALLYIDLDGFKAINDTGGHALGDMVLANVAHRLHSCLRASDPVGRIGGDEFAVLVTHLLDAEDAYRLADKIIATVSSLRVPGHESLRLGASIGVCLLPHPESNGVEAVMRMADMLMYRAKRAGKNCYISSGRNRTATAEA